MTYGGGSGERGGEVLKLFKKTLPVNGFSPSFTFEKSRTNVAWCYRFWALCIF